MGSDDFLILANTLREDSEYLSQLEAHTALMTVGSLEAVTERKILTESRG